MIELRDVTKRYEKNIAVRNLFLSVNEGEVCTLIGPSGCGKSTTIKLINRMLDPENGEGRVQQIEAMMKVLKDQQEARRLEENGKKGKRGK